MRTARYALATAFSLGAGYSVMAVPVAPTILLTINDSDPSAVTITATEMAANASSQIDSITLSDGIDLEDFFQADESGTSSAPMLNGSLEGSGTGMAYGNVGVDDYSTGGSAPAYDLHLYTASQTTSQTFSTSPPAFTGSWTIDLTDLGIDVADLPRAGSSGSIVVGDSASSAANGNEPLTIIGNWQVVSDVPEPSTYALMGFSLA